MSIDTLLEALMKAEQVCSAFEAELEEAQDYLEHLVYEGVTSRFQSHIGWLHYDADGTLLTQDEVTIRSVYTGDNPATKERHEKMVQNTLQKIADMYELRGSTGNFIKTINEHEELDPEILEGFMKNKPLLNSAPIEVPPSSYCGWSHAIPIHEIPPLPPGFYSPFITVTAINIPDTEKIEMLWKNYYSSGDQSDEKA